MSATSMPAPLIYVDTPFALPTFRMYAFFDTDMKDDAFVAAGVALMDMVVAEYGGTLRYMLQGGRGQPGRTNKYSAKRYASARDWLLTPPRHHGSTLRLHGFDDAIDMPTVPHFRIEGHEDNCVIQIELAPDAPGLLDFADRVTEAFTRMPLICGVMGLGFYLPASKDSLIWMLPMTTARYRCALEVQPKGAECAVNRHNSTDFARNRTLTSGIADIGWRTLVGAQFLDRVPDLGRLAAVPDVTVDARLGVAIITAGPSPLWGDVNRGEDITPYRAVAKALAPLRMDPFFLKGFLFGGGAGSDPERMDRIEAYVNRFGD